MFGHVWVHTNVCDSVRMDSESTHVLCVLSFPPLVHLCMYIHSLV